MLLDGKVAVVYGSGGMGGGIARGLARNGAVVHLTGRTRPKLDAVAADITAAGGTVHTAVVDAYDEEAIVAHLDGLNRVDISVNTIGLTVVQNRPMVDIALEDLVRPVAEAARTQFATGRAVARRMIEQGSGVIIMLSSSASYPSGFETGGFGTACSAVEGIARSLGGELGQHGVRVLAVRPNFTPETVPEPLDLTDPGLAPLIERTALKRLPYLSEVAETISFLASDHAGAITSTTVDLSCGTTTH